MNLISALWREAFATVERERRMEELKKAREARGQRVSSNLQRGAGRAQQAGSHLQRGVGRAQRTRTRSDPQHMREVQQGQWKPIVRTRAQRMG